MNMQREDFLALCKGPAPLTRSIYGFGPGRTAAVQTHSGVGVSNQIRVMEDWFPNGQMFEFLNTVCFSKGVDIDQSKGFPVPRLKVLAPAASGGLEVVYFSVKEVLSIANQVSVDTLNRLNGVTHRDLQNHRKD
jgi:hypothetical protein